MSENNKYEVFGITGRVACASRGTSIRLKSSERVLAVAVSGCYKALV